MNTKTVTLKRVNATLRTGIALSPECVANAMHKCIIESFLSSSNTFAGLTLTSMLARRLGMPDITSERNYQYALKHPAGGIFLIW